VEALRSLLILASTGSSRKTEFSKKYIPLSAILKSKKFRPKGRGMENVLLANPWFPLQAYIFRPKGRGITPKLLLN
jgi:hypothetical protein